MVMMWGGLWAAQSQAALGVLRVAVPDGLLCLPGENLTFYEFSEDFYQTQVELPWCGSEGGVLCTQRSTGKVLGCLLC